MNVDRLVSLVSSWIVLLLLLAGCGESPGGGGDSQGPADKPAEEGTATELTAAEQAARQKAAHENGTEEDAATALARKKGAAAPLSQEAKIRDLLARKKVKGLVWDETNLDQAVSYLRTITGVDFYISPKVRAEKFDDIVISLNVDSVSIATVLNTITTPFGLRWEPREGVVHLLTTEELTGKPELRFYDVKDLLRGAAKAGAASPEARESAFASEPELIEFLRAEVFPRYWGENGGAIEARDGVLTVRAPGALHEALEACLSMRRRGAVPYKLPDDVLKKIRSTKVNLQIETEQLADVLKTLQITTGMNLMIDPRIAADVQANEIVGLNLANAPLETALNMLAAACGEDGAWMAQGNVLVLTHKEYLPGG